VGDCVAKQIAHCARQCFRVSPNPYRVFGSDQRDILTVGQSERCNLRNSFGANANEIGTVLRTDDERFHLGDVEQLVHRPAHRVDVSAEQLRDRFVLDRVDAHPQHAKWGAQLVRRIGDKLALES